ncbi:serpin family protein [Candidatus Uabimicrobium amorphum]|uniref:Serine/threonine protein kinase n=1 Tax=Uabimicrobium amorphum TaxID=2596890 RepID=A0A5S9IQX1_UABAM|nr:serpin family protein [Candidatus Uabimicrobium amorphum]BBM85996.1 serine/threonine protein kinase [Candidatus Uabimicrobium amorphum]
MKIVIYALCALCISCSSSLPVAKFSPKEKSNAPLEQISPLVTGNNAFAWNLYEQLGQKPGNLFFSPYSISTALGMAYVGARENTATQMKNTLQFPTNDPHVLFSGLVDRVQNATTDYKLYVANALWGQKGYEFLPAFLETTGKNYGAGLYEVDFSSNTETARQTINAWVEKNTADKIQELFKEGAIKNTTRLALTNTIYFKADWLNQFESMDTSERQFQMNSESTVKVPMMQQNTRIPHYKQQDFQAVALAYKGKQLEMLIFLPAAIDGLAQLEKNLDAKKIAEVREKMTQKSTLLMMPKFKSSSSFELAEVLKALGMKEAFSNSADFSGITKTEKLMIDKVVHKAVVNVDEEGTEAAAATGITMRPTSAIMNDVQFIADHPFLFTISHVETGSILFMGRVVNPK